MNHRVAKTLRNLAGLTGQRTALANAAEGSAVLRQRRQDQEHVEEYLQDRLLTAPMGATTNAERGEHGAEHGL